MKINDDHIFRPHHPLAEAGGRDQHAVLVQPDRKVSVRGGHKTHAVEQFAEAGKLPAQVTFPAGCFTGKSKSCG